MSVEKNKLKELLGVREDEILCSMCEDWFKTALTGHFSTLPKYSDFRHKCKNDGCDNNLVIINECRNKDSSQ